MKNIKQIINSTPKKKIGLYIIISALVIFFSANLLIAPVIDFQIDVTENQSNTISQDTKNILQEIISPITIKLYYSPALGDKSPIFSDFYNKARDILIRYKNEAPKKINLEIYLISELSDYTKDAMEYGLAGIPLSHEVNGYLGLVMSDELNNEKIIPILNPYMFVNLEYDITKLLFSLINLNKPIIGIMSDYPVLSRINYSAVGGKTKTLAWGFAEIMQDFYDVIEIPPNTLSIPPEIQVMIVMSPTTITEYTSYALEQYLLRGGKMILLLDNYSKVAPVFLYPPYKETPLRKLTEALGIKINNKMVISDLTSAHEVYTKNKLGQVSSDIFWIDLNNSSFNKDSSILAPISSLSFHSAGGLEISEDTELKVTDLIKSSNSARLMSTDYLHAQEDLDKLKNRFSPGTEPLLISARLQGEFKSNYEAPPKLYIDNKKQLREEHLPQSIAPADVVVVSDVDFTYDHFWNFRLNDLSQPVFNSFAENADFLVNIIDEMLGQYILTDLRNKVNNNKGFTGLKEYESSVIAEYSAINAELFVQEEAIRKEIAELNKNINKQNLNISDIQKVQTLERALNEIQLMIKRNNLIMQNKIKNFTIMIINLNLFSIPVLLLFLAVFKLIKRKLNVS